MLRSPLTLSHLVLWLALLAPLAGFAQSSEEAPPTAAAPMEESLPPPLVPAPEDAARPAAQGKLFPREPRTEDPRDTWLVPRIILQAPAGFLLGGAFGLASLFPVAFLTDAVCDGSLIEGEAHPVCYINIITGVGLSASLGAALAVTGIGKLMHGRGRFWPTALGAVLGTAAGFGLAALSKPHDEVIIGISLAGTALGATVGFTASESYVAKPTALPPQAGTGVSIMPMVSATRTGGLMGGLVGRF